VLTTGMLLAAGWRWLYPAVRWDSVRGPRAAVSAPARQVRGRMRC